MTIIFRKTLGFIRIGLSGPVWMVGPVFEPLQGGAGGAEMTGVGVIMIGWGVSPQVPRAEGHLQSSR